MAERACCDDIIDSQARIKSLEDWRDEYIVSAQRWREEHEKANKESNERMFKTLDEIKDMLRSWVNPVLAVVISVLVGLLGLLGGALWAALR